MKNKTLIFLFLAVIALSSCGGASYPKENITQLLEELVMKESGEASKASIVGKTLYLDVELAGLASQEQSEAMEAVRKMQSAAFAVTRVILSSDSDIKYMVLNVYDPGKNIAFRLFQSIDDIKSYMYMRISRSDYESRNVFEIEGPGSAQQAVDNKYDLSLEEYVARMISANVSMASRSNPFMGALMSALNLKYKAVEDGTLIFSSAMPLDDKTAELLKNILAEETKKYSGKYGISFKSVKIVNRQDNGTFEFPVADNS